jgi:hypothetical protein
LDRRLTGPSLGGDADRGLGVGGHDPAGPQQSDLQPWQKKSWCRPTGVDGDFIDRREDVREWYAQPHDPQRPVVCFGECSKEFRGPVAEPIPPAPGRPAKEDDESTREGTANRFVIVEPLAGTRQVTVTERRAIPDFAAPMKYRCDEWYPDAAVIRVVLDNRNTHAFGSRFATFPPDEAWRWARRLEFHDPPKHASWLNLAECEWSVLSGQCLNRRIARRETLASEVASWVVRRNAQKAKIDWTFRVADARKKLDFLYPEKLVR